MAYRASPPRKVAAWTKTELSDAEAAPALVADFVNLEASHMTHSGGFAQGVFAIMPDKHDYDRIRFLFSNVVTADVASATVAVYVMLSGGDIVVAGTAALTAAGTIPAIEIENYQGLYSVILQAVTATEAGTIEFSTDVYVQGVHQGYIQ
jgi:threonine dehydratase